MPILKKLAPITLVICAACKEPPNVDPCLLKIQLSPAGAIDLTASKAFCTPVNTKHAPYTLGIDKLNHFYAYSNVDNATLTQWIANNMK